MEYLQVTSGAKILRLVATVTKKKPHKSNVRLSYINSYGITKPNLL